MKFSHEFHPSVLREYDIRGIVGETLSVSDASAIGHLFGTIVRRNGGSRVCVGYDGRLSSPAMEAALIDGLLESGINVDRIGRGPTPMLYYAVFATVADGGIMITGSHNPPSHNGFKMMVGKKPFFGADIKKLALLAKLGDVETGKGIVKDKYIFPQYIQRIRQAFQGQKILSAVWDPGNGSGGEAVRELVKNLPGRHIVINGDIDGSFPAHHPDPTVSKNLEQLITRVKVEKADVGFAFDGDADRIGIVDGQGRILCGDQIMQVLAEDVLKEYPGAPIIVDVKTSQAFFDEVSRMGGRPVMWKTGHSLIKNKMAELEAPLAGEMSGHIFYADKYYGFDDAIYVAIRFLSIMASSENFDLIERYNRFPVMINTPEMRFPCADERKFSVIEEVKKRLQKSESSINDIDGVRVSKNGGWWLLRASNTQAVLVARAEADTAANLEILREEIAAQLKASGIDFPVDVINY